MDLEEFDDGLKAPMVKNRSQTHSFDISSVKEVDPRAHFQQVGSSQNEQTLHEEPTVAARLQMQIIQSKGGVHQETLAGGSELEELLNAGRDELLKTSILSLKDLSNEKIVSLMQLILESGDHSNHGYPQPLPKVAPAHSTAGLRLFNKLISRMKAFVAIRFITRPRSQLHKVFAMTRTRKGRGSSMQMSEAVAEVLEGSYLSDLQHLALPPCNLSTIVRALICGRVSTLQHLELQGHLDSWQYSKSRPLRSLFLCGLLQELHHLGLSRCVEVEEMEVLATAFDVGKLPALTHLDLSSNLLQGESRSRCLAKLVKCRAMVDLELLNLQNCGISDEGMQALASAMNSSRGPWKLRYLNLGSNEIGDNGFAALLRVMKKDRLPQLHELHLLYNYGIGEESKVEAANILEEGHVPRLQVFYLSSHSITDRVAEAFLAAYKNNTQLTVELLGIWWPNEVIERQAANYRERNLGLLSSSQTTLALQQ